MILLNQITLFFICFRYNIPLCNCNSSAFESSIWTFKNCLFALTSYTELHQGGSTVQCEEENIIEFLTGDLPLPPLPSFSLPAIPLPSLLPPLDFCTLWTNSHSCRHACHKMKKHREPKHWLLQGRNGNIKLIVLLVLTLAWSFHIWVVDKSINYTSFLHLTCSNQGFQTLSCPAQQWSCLPSSEEIIAPWENVCRFSFFLSWYAQISPISRFYISSMVLEGFGVRWDSSHLSWPRHS